MDLTPTSGRFQLTPAEDEQVIKTFSSVKEWLSTPITPPFSKNKAVGDSPSYSKNKAVDDSPSYLKNEVVDDSPSFLKNKVVDDSPPFLKKEAADDPPPFFKNEAINGSVAVTTEHPSTDQTKVSTHPSATGISESSQQETKGPRSILESINRILSPESKTRGAMPPKRAILPTSSPQITEQLTGFERESQRSKLSWNISDGLSDDGNQDEPKQHTTAEDAATSRTMAWLLKTFKAPAIVQLTPSGSAINHYKRDIDTDTGDFLPEISYPDTFKTLHEGACCDHRDMAWRQANMTAELHINREIRSRELLATKLRTQLKHQTEDIPIEQAAWPKAECVVRPATPKDFQAIAIIMNMERQAKGSPQVFEWKDVTAADIQKIYNSCRGSLWPFIVATTAGDTLLDRSNWPEGATKAYQSYVAFRSSQAQPQQEILGFAFVTEARVGILGTPCPGSRHAGQAKVIVHPDHRGKLYGSALLDRILLCTAPFHRSLVDYEWQCQDSANIYESISFQNRRKYAWIYVETFCDGKDDPACKAAASFLEKFEFKEVCCLPSAIKTDRYYDSRWLDLVLWARETQPRSDIVDLAPGAQ